MRSPSSPPAPAANVCSRAPSPLRGRAFGRLPPPSRSGLRRPSVRSAERHDDEDSRRPRDRDVRDVAHEEVQVDEVDDRPVEELGRSHEPSMRLPVRPPSRAPAPRPRPRPQRRPAHRITTNTTGDDGEDPRGVRAHPKAAPSLRRNWNTASPRSPDPRPPLQLQRPRSASSPGPHDDQRGRAEERARAPPGRGAARGRDVIVVLSWCLHDRRSAEQSRRMQATGGRSSCRRPGMNGAGPGRFRAGTLRPVGRDVPGDAIRSSGARCLR